VLASAYPLPLAWGYAYEPSIRACRCVTNIASLGRLTLRSRGRIPALAQLQDAGACACSFSQGLAHCPPPPCVLMRPSPIDPHVPRGSCQVSAHGGSRLEHTLCIARASGLPAHPTPALASGRMSHPTPPELCLTGKRALRDDRLAVAQPQAPLAVRVTCTLHGAWPGALLPVSYSLPIAKLISVRVIFHGVV
jgi:hypothetical protein